jgi:hypothetical protein
MVAYTLHNIYYSDTSISYWFSLSGRNIWLIQLVSHHFRSMLYLISESHTSIYHCIHQILCNTSNWRHPRHTFCFCCGRLPLPGSDINTSVTPTWHREISLTQPTVHSVYTKSCHFASKILLGYTWFALYLSKISGSKLLLVCRPVTTWSGFL